MGFLHGQPWLRTPHLDSLARDGAHLKNAFVTTALCSPSRATILTGQYAHRHRIVDNNTAIPAGTRFFPQLLHAGGYKTAFIGKWHMGNAGDEPQPGFDHWVSFRGQGSYLPNKNGLNVDGSRVPQKGYITDELTDYALRWMDAQPREQPFFLYLSHKAVHADFVPAERHKGMYATRDLRPAPPPWRPKAPTRSTVPCGCRTSATVGTAWTFPITPSSTSATTTSATPKRSWAWTTAWAACSKRSAGAANSIPPSSSTWATTASPSASTA